MKIKQKFTIPQTGPTNAEGMERVVRRRVTLKLFSFFQLVHSRLPDLCWHWGYRRRRSSNPIPRALQEKKKEKKKEIRKTPDFTEELELGLQKKLNLAFSLGFLRVFDSPNHFYVLMLFSPRRKLEWRRNSVAQAQGFLLGRL